MVSLSLSRLDVAFVLTFSLGSIVHSNSMLEENCHVGNCVSVFDSKLIVVSGRVVVILSVCVVVPRINDRAVLKSILEYKWWCFQENSASVASRFG
jgi:hypothetical protein